MDIQMGFSTSIFFIIRICLGHWPMSLNDRWVIRILGLKKLTRLVREIDSQGYDTPGSHVLADFYRLASSVADSDP